MLVLTRRLGESITIDDNIRIVVVQVKGKQVRLGVEAPPNTVIHRKEVYDAIHHAQPMENGSDTYREGVWSNGNAARAS